MAEVLNSIYETDFLGFSYGFRPGRRAHEALDALAIGIRTQKISWVLDADIRGYFDAIHHDWMMRFLEHRIADRRVLRLIWKELREGHHSRFRTDCGAGHPRLARQAPAWAPPRPGP